MSVFLPPPGAVIDRLDTSCTRWPAHMDEWESKNRDKLRCDECDGCTAYDWLRGATAECAKQPPLDPSNCTYPRCGHLLGVCAMPGNQGSG